MTNKSHQHLILCRSEELTGDDATFISVSSDCKRGRGSKWTRILGIDNMYDTNLFEILLRSSISWLCNSCILYRASCDIQYFLLASSFKVPYLKQFHALLIMCIAIYLLIISRSMYSILGPPVSKFTICMWLDFAVCNGLLACT